MIDTVEEQVDIRSRTELLMVILTQLALGGIELRRDGQQSVDNRRTSGNYVIPVQVGKGRLGEDVEVLAEILFAKS